jgi:NCAIR mutase (PurE)-related protein
VPFARPDFLREDRKGVPEVILAQGKEPDAVLAITRSFLERTGRAIISRVSQDLEDRLRKEMGPDITLDWHAASRCAVLRAPEWQASADGGEVGVITAGTSDIPIAEEAAILCREMGCQVHTVYDVGVAGLHRLYEPLEELVRRHGVDVIVVAAGMDGALPSVVSGLVDVPVIGLPTSIGYGLGGRGEAALLSMLQTCSPGLAVVNIDNGIGAGAMAGLIARRASGKQGNER